MKLKWIWILLLIGFIIYAKRQGDKAYNDMIKKQQGFTGNVDGNQIVSEQYCLANPLSFICGPKNFATWDV